MINLLLAVLNLFKSKQRMSIYLENPQLFNCIFLALFLLFLTTHFYSLKQIRYYGYHLSSRVIRFTCDNNIHTDQVNRPLECQELQFLCEKI